MVSLIAPQIVTMVIADQLQEARKPMQLSIALTVMAGIEYGVAFTLFISCLDALRNNSKASQHMRRFLHAYVSLMFLLSTLYVLAAVISYTSDMTALLYNVPLTESCPQCFNLSKIMHRIQICCLALSIWGADGFMLWRCAILYEGVLWVRRVAIFVACCVLVVATFLSGVFYMALDTTPCGLTLITLSTISLSVNVVITALIVFRLLYHKKYLLGALGPGHGTMYTRIIAMCIEVQKVSVPLPSLYTFAFTTTFPVPIYAISPFMIIYRVAQGRSWTSPTRELCTQDIAAALDRQGIQSLRFARSARASVSGEA
ncbi:hypothetical protein B0H34DRAFT_101617 [Crassisporium funariophilum]|nr:hypothetical protein B0H34DRAFT_101617 [Crassisporium funariophilum]